MISRNSINGVYPIKRLGEVVEFLDSRRRPVTESERQVGPYPYYGANGIQGTIDDFIFDEPLVLLAEDGGHFGNPDRGIAYRISGKTWVNNHAHVLRPTSAIDLAYLCRVLENYDVTPFVTGTTRGKLTKAGASEIAIPLPSVAEQRRIAEILDRAEALRAKRRAALAELDTLPQALFLELFGDPVTNSKRWPISPLRNCTEKIQIGPFGSLLHQEDYISGGVPLVNPKHIQGGSIVPNHDESVTPKKYSKLGIYHLRHGDVVMGRRGEMGRCAMVLTSDSLLCGTGSLIIRPDNKHTTTLFVWAALSTKSAKESFERLSLGQTLPNLNSGIVEKFVLPLPPLPLQQEFARQVTAIEKLKATHRAALSDLDAMFASLQHRAFRGEL